MTVSATPEEVVIESPIGTLKRGAVIELPFEDNETLKLEIVKITDKRESRYSSDIAYMETKIVDDHYNSNRQLDLATNAEGDISGQMVVWKRAPNAWYEREFYYDIGQNKDSELYIWDHYVRNGKLIRENGRQFKKRDTQRNKLYRWEKTFQRATHKFDNLDEIQEYVDSITRTRWWKARSNWKHVEVKGPRGPQTRALSFRNRGMISLPERWGKWAYTKGVILHELAHLLVPGNVASHGKEYAKMYLHIVWRFLGKDAYRYLKWNFDLGGVKYRTGYDPRNK
jgi:putative metallohydrolase (TIGR04338 family)